MPYLTAQDLINLNLRFNSPSTMSDIFRQLIDDDIASSERSEKLDGLSYYCSNNDVENIDFTEYTDTHGVQQQQTNKADNRLSHGFHRRQVIEKVSYLLKNPITITFDSEDDNSDATVEKFTDVLGRKFQDTIMELSEGASNKGVEWLHFFFDGEKFDYMVVGSEGVIPVYETNRQKDLINLLRYFEITANTAGVDSTVYSLEWWSKDDVEFWTQDKPGGDFTLQDKRSHFKLEISATNESEDKGWGRVPFVPLLNNNQMKSDLHFVKSLIDVYDKQFSMFSNDLEDLQEAIIIAVGTADKPDEIRNNLKKFKVVVIQDEKGDLRPLTIDIPTEAKGMLLDRLENNIAAFGMATDFNTETFGSDPSGVALKWLYIPLDLKAGMLERKLIDVFHEVFWFVNVFLGLSKTGELKQDELLKFSFVLSKFMIVNEKEKVDMVVASKGIISKETNISNHPWVENVQAEIEALEEEEPEPVEPPEPNGRIIEPITQGGQP